MAAIPAAAEAHYRQMQRLQVLALRASRRAWSGVDSRFLSQSWAALVASQLVPVVSRVQVQAAVSGSSYGGLALAEQGVWVAPESFVDARAFGGVASDGRSLDGLLYSPVTSAKSWIAGGVSPAQALAMGRTVLDSLVRTVVADAGRQAASVDVAARRSVGYVRMLNPPSCSRCTVLAGKFYRWNAGFQRHPRCDCVHVASAVGSTSAARDEGLIDDPYEYFQGLPESEQNRLWGEANARAIRDGADIYQVTNARRGAKGMFTTEGTSRRGYAGSVLRRGQRRMTPDAIYRLNPNRADALQALRDQGYILPGGQVPGGSLRGRVEGFGALGRGGTRKAASQAVLEARRTGVRQPGVRYTMTDAERRLHDAEQRYQMVLRGENPYASPAFGNTPDPTGALRRAAAGSRGPLTPLIAAQVEADYRRWLATGGQIF